MIPAWFNYVACFGCGSRSSSYFLYTHIKISRLRITRYSPLVALITEGLVDGMQLRRRAKFALVALAATICVASILAITRADTISSKSMVMSYRQNAAPEEPLVFLQTYRFDVPFYAKLSEPIIVISKWDEAITKDSWSKELADAAKFSPSAGEKVLINTPDMLKILCAQPVTWVIAPAKYIANTQELQSLETVAHNSLYVLVKIPSSLAALACP